MIHSINAFYANEEIILILNFTSLILRAITLCTVKVFFNRNIHLPLSLSWHNKGTLLTSIYKINFQRLGNQRNVLIEFIVPLNLLLLVATSDSQARCSGQSYSICVQGYIQPQHHRCMYQVEKYGIGRVTQYGSCAHPQH